MNHYDERVKELEGNLSYRLNVRQSIMLSEAELRALEHELGAPLPAYYREFLRDYSGINIFGFNFYGVMPGESLDLLYMHQHYHQHEIMHSELAPIAVNIGGNHLCIALSGSRKGAIYFWILEEATVPASYDNTELVAESFDALMQSDHLQA